MIPLSRRSLSSRTPSLTLQVSRQALPRPARLYSQPSNRVASPALTTTPPSPSPSYPAFLPQDTTTTHTNKKSYEEMTRFLNEDRRYTFLPTPLPQTDQSDLDDHYFPETSLQDQVSIIDACLHNGYNVPRAKEIFERVRNEQRMRSQMSTRLYNAMLSAYVDMSVKDTAKSDLWVEDAVGLYESILQGENHVHPNANTYANMLLLHLHVTHHHTTGPISQMTALPKPLHILKSIIEREIPLALVVADKAFVEDGDAREVIRVLSRAAVDANLPNLGKVVMELGSAEALGSQIEEDMDIPEAMPVTKPKVVVKHASDGSVTSLQMTSLPSTEPETEIPFNLSTLRKHLSDVILARRVLSGDTLARQKLLEASVYDVAVERLKHQVQTLEGLGLGSKGLEHVDLRAWMWSWHVKLMGRLKGEVGELVRVEEKLADKSKDRLAPFLSLIKPENLSLITILELMHLHGSGGISEGMKTARALLSVGRAVEIEYKAQMCKKHNISIPTSSSSFSHSSFSHSPSSSNSFNTTSTKGRGTEDPSYFSHMGYRDLHARRVAARKFMEDSEDWTSEWSQSVRVRVGSFLVDALMDVATVTRTAVDRRSGERVSEEQPAFYHAYEYIRGHKLGIIKLNPVVSERMAKESLREALHPRHLPMLVQPKRWISYNDGGYLYNKAPVMRYKDSQEQLSYLKEASNLGNLELFYAALDVLGSTPWTINRRIFDVVLKVWNTGERLGKIPPAVLEDAEPVKPESWDLDPKAKAVYVARMKAWLEAKANNHSNRCSTNYKIEIARTFLHDTFYLPHTVDFRGRAYPLPPHLNQVGDDLSRGLMKFGEAKPLTERGLRWLKIHLANLYGYDKGTFDERVQFVEKHLEDVYDSAEKPLDGQGWWKNADDPWQCLACCMELKAALDSPDPTQFMSSLPVHQDGTCNGLQHYAALGGDDRGAQQVNLGVTDRPSDVYTHVATMVEAQIREDIVKEKDAKWANALTGKITRKVVKQTVMTTVYGVTYIGAREQIEKRLIEQGELDVEDAWQASAYLARKVLDCIGDLFTGAKGIQLWLNTAARLITKAIPPDRIVAASSGKAKEKAKTLRQEQMTSVIWTTPLGLPIVQPYRAVKRKQVQTALQTVFISDPNSPAAVNSVKQASAFPPNFIHSLDATHMMMTALECQSRGIMFASVHDSYWTHACDIDEMSAIIRDTFIALHSSDVLSKLDAEFRMRYAGYKVPLSSLSKELQAKIMAYASTSHPNQRHLEVSSIDSPEEAKDSQDLCDIEPETVTRFVNLVDILPPLPEKGHFDVNTIKKSLYFFS